MATAAHIGSLQPVVGRDAAREADLWQVAADKKYARLFTALDAFISEASAAEEEAVEAA